MSRAGRLLESARMRGRGTVRIGREGRYPPGYPPLRTARGGLQPIRGPSSRQSTGGCRPSRPGPGTLCPPASVRPRELRPWVRPVQVRGPCNQHRARWVPQPLPRAVGAAVPNPFVPDDSPSLRGSRRTPRRRQHHHPPPQPLNAGAGLLGNQRLAQHGSGLGTAGGRGCCTPSSGRAALGVLTSPRLVPAPRLASEGSGSMTSDLVWDHHDGMVIPTAAAMSASIAASPSPTHLMFHYLMVTKKMVYEINQV